MNNGFYVEVYKHRLIMICTMYCKFTEYHVTWYLYIENRIYREEFTREKCETAILLYCFHTAGVLHIFMLYNLLGPGISFYRKCKIIVKRKPNYEIGWFIIDQWSFHIDSMHSTVQTMIFRYNYKSNYGFYSPNSL